MLSGDFLQLLLKDGVLDVAVIFDEYKSLRLRLIFDSTIYDDLSYKRDMEEIIFFE